MTRQFASIAQHSRIPTEKDYYKVLGVDSTATPEQIKEAYRQMVKMHHPDVQGSAQPDAAKFRDVMEAFGVLSVRESRVNYDLLKRKNPDAYKEVSEA
jgi:DnaJ-class molecular chaperone